MPDEVVEFIRSIMLPLRINFLKCAIFGDTDFGWQPFEKVHALDEQGRVTLIKLKPLLQDITTILIQASGAFNGYLQEYGDGSSVVLPVEKTIHVATQVEGSDWYGRALLENIRKTYNCWIKTEEGAELYDKKMAGAHWLIRFPVGSTDVLGKTTDNATVAANVLKALIASSSVSIPVEQQAHPDAPAWDVKLIGDAVARQPSFIVRQEYLDKQLVRGMLFPERSLTEGIHGTKAEAGVHLGLVITNLGLLHDELTTLANVTCVDELLRVNFGPEAMGTVRLVPAPIVDEHRAFLQDLYLKIITNPAGFLEESSQVDTDAMKDMLGVPKTEEVTDGLEGDDDDDGAVMADRLVDALTGIDDVNGNGRTSGI